MNKNARTIQIFLPNGDPKGIKVATMSRGDLQAIMVPRTMLVEAGELEEMQNVSIYLLFGEGKMENLKCMWVKQKMVMQE